MDRRAFLTALLAAPVVAALPAVALARVQPSFDDLVRETLRKRSPQIAANIMQNNALLARLRAHQSRQKP